MRDRMHLELVQLTQILSQSVGVIEFESDDYREATELFIRFNSTGRKLNRSDLHTAELAVKVQGLASEKIAAAAHRWAAFRFTMPFLVQCLLAVHSGRLKSQPDQAWGDSTDAEIRESWRSTERGLAEVIRFITGTVKWTSASLVPSFNALIPLVYVTAHNGPLSESDRILARRWLLLSGVHKYFSGSGWSDLDRVLRKIGDKPSVRSLWNATHTRLTRLRPADFDTSRISGPITSMYVSMLREHDARDWARPDERIDGSVVGLNAGLQVHHFFPRALLKRHGWDSGWINTFANYTLISASTNLDVLTEEPATYMARLKVSEKQLEIQCIPADKSLWGVERYEEFIIERQKLLAARSNEFLGIGK
jgi:hypothetical protein